MTNPYSQDPHNPDDPGQQSGYDRYRRDGQYPQQPDGYPMYDPQADYRQDYGRPAYDQGYGYGQGQSYVQGYGYDAPAGAGGGRRLLAYLIDGFVVGVIVNILASVTGVYPAMGPGMMDDPAMMDAWLDQTARTGATIGVLTTVVFYIYAVFLQTTDFSTVGKRLAGIRVTEQDGSALSVGTSAKRNAWLLAGLVPGFGGLITFVLGLIIFFQAGQGDRTQGLNDRWAKTRVVKRR